MNYQPLLNHLSENGISKGQLAKGASLSTATLAKLAKGQEISLLVLERIAGYLNVDVSKIVEFDTSKQLSPVFEAMSGFGKTAFKNEFLSVSENTLLGLMHSYTVNKNAGSFWASEILSCLLEAAFDPISIKLLKRLIRPLSQIVKDGNPSVLPRDDLTNSLKKRDFQGFARAWAGQGSFNEAEQASFFHQACLSLNGLPLKEVLAWMLLFKEKIRSGGLPPVFGKELLPYVTIGLADYENNPTYLISAFEAGLAVSNNLAAKYGIPLS